MIDFLEITIRGLAFGAGAAIVCGGFLFIGHVRARRKYMRDLRERLKDVRVTTMAFPFDEPTDEQRNEQYRLIAEARKADDNHS